MDDVVDQLEAVGISADDENRTRFDDLYKNWGRLGNQNERRREILVNQKKNRYTKLDKFRGILDLVDAVERRGTFKTHNPAYYRPTIYVAGFTKAPTYSQVLMMSEWMVEKPVDFEENWMVVPAPKGTRTLIVAKNGITRFYSKHGHFMFQRRTGLPGGNPCDPKAMVNSCVLDGFYVKKEDVLYVLDCLSWNLQAMTDGEFEFRDHWLKSQFYELDSLPTLSKKNEIVIHLLPKRSCTDEVFRSFVMQVHFKISTKNECNELDGLLFYHKKAQYLSGETPLVGWLYPFMIPEVFGEHIRVNNVYMIQKPDDYIDQADYIKKFAKKQEAKKSKSRKSSGSATAQMDTVDAPAEGTSAETAPAENSRNQTNTSMESYVQYGALPKIKTQRKSKPSKKAAQVEIMEADESPDKDAKSSTTDGA